MANWSLDDIPWHQFDATKIKPELLCLARAACMVEHNGYDYARYLKQVFADNPALQATMDQWAEEEVQHGRALRKWAELADPHFNFDESFATFTEGYKLPLDVKESVRGSRSGELIARCVVESGTSSYYTAMKEYTDEPVLEEICARIAADEFRHYKLFYTLLKDYLAREKIGPWECLRIALTRVTESEDDELAYAFYAAHRHHETAPYRRKTFMLRYYACATAMYKKPHVEKMAAMVLKAAGLKPQALFGRLMTRLAWLMLRFKTARSRAYLPA